MQIPFQLWIDDYIVQQQQPWHARSGHSITLQIRRRVVPFPSAQGADMHSLLQLNMQNFSQLNQHDAPVKMISLHDLIPEDNSHGHDEEFDSQLPDELLLPDGSTETEVEVELNKSSRAFHVYATGYYNIMLTVPFDWSANANWTHYV